MTQAIIKYRAHVQCACGTECVTDVVHLASGLEPGALPQGWKAGTHGMGSWCPRCSALINELNLAAGIAALGEPEPEPEPDDEGDELGATQCAVCLGSLEFGWNQRGGDVVCAACSSAPCASGSAR